MAKASWFHETEKAIQCYWKRQLRIDRLRAQLKAAEAKLRTLESELAEVKRLPRITAKYGVTPGVRQGSFGCDELMVEYEEQLAKLTTRIFMQKKNCVKLRLRLNGLEERQAPMELLIRRLPYKAARLLELRYVYRWSNYAIGRDLSYSEHGIREMYARTVERLATWLGKV